MIMNVYIKRIIKSILCVGFYAAIFVYIDIARKGLTLEQVLTTRFWILSTINLIPTYFIVWTSEDDSISSYEKWMIGSVIIFVWLIFFGIIWAIAYFLFGYNLLF